MEIKPEEKFYPNGKILSRRYLNTVGKCHREPSEGPAYEKWHENGHIANQQYLINGKLHRDPLVGPAVEYWNKEGNKVDEHYYVDDKKVSKPKAKVDMEVKPQKQYYPNGQIRSCWYSNTRGAFSRDPNEGPAYQAWFENGQKRYECYFVDGKDHRDPSQGPARETWKQDGTKLSEAYYVDGKEVPKPDIKVEKIKPIEEFYLNGNIKFRSYRNAAGVDHRDPLEGPAHEGWHANGQKWFQQYIVDGKTHRDPNQGPAAESWHDDGSIKNRSYWLDGRRVSKPDIDNSEVNKTAEEFGAKAIIISLTTALLVSCLKSRNNDVSIKQNSKLEHIAETVHKK